MMRGNMYELTLRGLRRIPQFSKRVIVAVARATMGLEADHAIPGLLAEASNEVVHNES